MTGAVGRPGPLLVVFGKVRIGPEVAGTTSDDPVAEALVAHCHVHALDGCDIGYPFIDPVGQASEVGSTARGPEGRPSLEGIGRNGDPLSFAHPMGPSATYSFGSKVVCSV